MVDEVAGVVGRFVPGDPRQMGRVELPEQVRHVLVAVQRRRVVGLALDELAGGHADVLTARARVSERVIVRQPGRAGPQRPG